jgi:hypothetical protein
MPSGLTVLAPIRAGEEEVLRGILRAIGDDIRGRELGDRQRPHIHFAESRGIHFARFALMDDSDRGPDRQRLLYSSNYDGDLDSHLAELVRITTDMDAIWGRCERYTGVGDFAAFIRAHAHSPQAFYIAYPEESVASIRRDRRARHALDAWLDRMDAGMRHAVVAAMREPGRAAMEAWERAAQRVRVALRALARALPVLGDLWRAIRRSGLRDVFYAVQRITASLDRVPLLRVLNRLTGNRMPRRRSPWSTVRLDNCAPYAPMGPRDEIPSILARGTHPGFREDAVTQNQLTLVTVVDSAQLSRLHAVLAAIDSYAKRFSPPGSLIGISTIHFVRWVLIDEGRRLMLLSDYDGSWESYIDEFAEMILSGLDAIWESAFGMPAQGASDLAAFKQFLRSHQVPSEIFFSAYPDATVVNIAADREFSRALAAHAGIFRRGPIGRGIQL